MRVRGEIDDSYSYDNNKKNIDNNNKRLIEMMTVILKASSIHVITNQLFGILRNHDNVEFDFFYRCDHHHH